MNDDDLDYELENIPVKDSPGAIGWSDSGNPSVVFYGANVFFEKLRVKKGKPKGKSRTEMERIHGSAGGIITERVQDR
ncbi:hypothetical protein BDV96DRAFT_647315 [Lophiotrema nucula]|uniref:Uncharacterized protein n=1 Tax=Lophiotrema nucula TaxID=690887 RepID=A0A6A5Z555_9PLEO|nr:hypothetical protein BDV96DRAFT_647315 [Lophiotrema nucula]